MSEVLFDGAFYKDDNYEQRLVIQEIGPKIIKAKIQTYFQSHKLPPHIIEYMEMDRSELLYFINMLETERDFISGNQSRLFHFRKYQLYSFVFPDLYSFTMTNMESENVKYKVKFTEEEIDGLLSFIPIIHTFCKDSID